MEKLIQKISFFLLVMAFNILLFSCIQQREGRDQCQKRVQLRVFQTCVNERQNTNGSQTEYADQFCFISLLDYAQCSDR